MNILLTNDDGIRAPGIVALHDVLAGLDPAVPKPLGDELQTIAPLTVQSATSHGVTFHEPLMVSEVTVHESMDGLAVDGRPADCVKLALAALWPERFGTGTRPDIVISGMNAGANCGINVIYSGTVAAAIEAAFLGIPAIAVSLHLGAGRPDFRAAARHARRAIDAVLATDLLTAHSCININIPRCEHPGEGYSQARAEAEARDAGSRLSDLNRTHPPTDPIEHGPDARDPHHPEAPMPIAVCPMNTHGIVDRFERRESPGGQQYYWAAGGGLDFHATDPGTDVAELFARHITVTPLRYDLSDDASMAAWRDAIAAGALITK
ncbi:MAG: 5'/3'-nucleotidase SurE [Planctomycetota bacterium]